MGAEHIEYYTYEDYKNWEGDWELIDGIIYAMSPFALPSHQKTAVRIVTQLEMNSKNCPQCHALMESEVKFSDETVVRPDVFIKCGELEDISITPQIIFEIISKGSVRRDELLKFNLYKQEGVRYYVLVYPDSKKAKVYKLINGEYIKIQEIQEDILQIEDLECKVYVDFGEVWF